jgi:pre-mRNA-splicing factor RBM22/SLT11
MSSIKRDAIKKKWEDTDFPLVCETCLGDNPYLRMTAEPHGKKCRICNTPFTVFAWQAGTKGRLKRVEICKSCARAKNVCQVCIYDLDYGLPVAVRDKILREEGGTQQGGSILTTAVPQSDANRSWFNAQQARMIENGELDHNVSTAAHAKLSSVARMEPRYERNLPKLCSFFAKGECNRGANCPFRHEMPRDRNDPFSKQNTKDRFYGTNDPVAKKMIWRRHQIEEAQKKAEAIKEEQDGDERAIATCYVCFDTKDEATKNIQISEQDLRDYFYSHGEIASVRMHQDKGAFIEYTTGEAAELAINTMDKQIICGRKILVTWARQPKRGNSRYGVDAVGAEGGDAKVEGPLQPMAPPGSSGSGSDKKENVATCLPVGFTPSAQVAAAAKARALTTSGLASTGLAAPKAGGGAIRRVGAGIRGPAPKPYYPSADPNRLGTATKQS